MSMGNSDIAALLTQAMIQRGYFDEITDCEKCTVNESRAIDIVATYKNFIALLQKKTDPATHKEFVKVRQDM